MANGKKEMHRQEDMIDTLDHRHPYGKIYCPHCKHEAPDYHDSCGHCGEDVGYQLGSMETSDKPGWISRDAGNLTSDDDKAMRQDAIRDDDKKASLSVTFENAWGIMKSQGPTEQNIAEFDPPKENESRAEKYVNDERKAKLLREHLMRLRPKVSRLDHYPPK